MFENNLAKTLFNQSHKKLQFEFASNPNISNFE